MPVYEWQGFNVAGQCNGHRQGYPLVPFRSFDAKIPSFPSPSFYPLCSLQPLFQIKFPFLLKRTAKLSVRVSSSEENKYRSSFPSKSLSTYSASSFLRSLLLPKISLRPPNPHAAPSPGPAVQFIFIRYHNTRVQSRESRFFSLLPPPFENSIPDKPFISLPFITYSNPKNGRTVDVSAYIYIYFFFIRLFFFYSSFFPFPTRQLEAVGAPPRYTPVI